MRLMISVLGSVLLAGCGSSPPDGSDGTEIQTGNAVTDTLNTAITSDGGADVLPTTGAPGTAGSRALEDAPQNTSALIEDGAANAGAAE